MVLEYGDIDLARLLTKQEAQRKAVPGSEPDENFIRLYWQQMLQVHCTSFVLSRTTRQTQNSRNTAVNSVTPKSESLYAS